MVRLSVLSAALVVASLLAAPSRAQLSLPTHFGHHMVLQQGEKIPVWGKARPDEAVAVTFRDQTVRTRANAQGNWSLELEPCTAGGPFVFKVDATEKITLQNVMVGEVWVCSGQSNMNWSVARSARPEQEIANSNYPDIRLYAVPQTIARQLPASIRSEWHPCGPGTVGPFSAVAYSFGRKLYEELGVPIGLIHSSWGGTPAEAWTSKEALETDPSLRSLVVEWKAKHTAWQEAVKKARENNEPGPRPPRRSHKPAALFNSMIEPLTPLAMRGVIWYQGESNVLRSTEYQRLFPRLIRSWRDQWGQGEFPFLFVQLASFKARVPLNFAKLREAQRMTLRTPNTGMAVTIDIGNPDDIHPKNKQEVGRRLALWALAKCYNRDLVHSGPLFESAEIDGDAIRCRFTHVGTGLAARDGKALTGFEIATETGRFAPAVAEIEGDTIVLRSESVKKPAFVRYAFANVPECNLINKEGLPASPFRTDNRAE